MKRALIYLVLLVAAVGLIMNLDLVLLTIFNSLLFILALGVVLYLIYYFFYQTEDQRKYKKALRKAKRRRRKK